MPVSLCPALPHVQEHLSMLADLRFRTSAWSSPWPSCLLHRPGHQGHVHYMRGRWAVRSHPFTNAGSAEAGIVSGRCCARPLSSNSQGWEGPVHVSHSPSCGPIRIIRRFSDPPSLAEDHLPSNAFRFQAVNVYFSPSTCAGSLRCLAQPGS